MSSLKSQSLNQRIMRTSKQQSKKTSRYSDSFASQNDTNNQPSYTEQPSSPKHATVTSLLQEKDNTIIELMHQIEKIQKEYDKNVLQCLKLEQKISTSPMNSNRNTIFSNANTSTNFLLNSEIQKKWETFGLYDIINNFVDFEESPDIIYHLIQEMFRLCIIFIREIIEDKFTKISSILHLPNDQDTFKNLENYTKPIFQEHLTNIFNNESAQSNFFNKFIYHYEQFFSENFDNKFHDTFKDITSTKEFKMMLDNVKEIILFCEFNVPKLDLRIEDFHNRTLEVIDIKDSNQKIKKTDMIIVNNIEDKFLKNVIVLLRPPTINGYIYNKNLKMIVYPTPLNFLFTHKNSYSSTKLDSNLLSTTSPKNRNSLSPQERESNERCLTENSVEKASNVILSGRQNPNAVSKKLDFSNVNKKKASKPRLSNKNIYNINYCNTGSDFTNRNKKRNSITNQTNPYMRKPESQKENIIKMIKQKAKNTFDSNKPPKNGNNLKSDLRCKSGSKTKSIQTKYNSMARNTTKPVIKNKSLSKSKTTRMNQQPHQMYTTPDVNQIINNNIKLQKGVIIKVEGNRKKKDYIVNSDSNYRTGFTDETCSNSSQQQDNKGAKPFSVIKLAKSKNNTSNSKNKYKGYNNRKDNVNGNNRID